MSDPKQDAPEQQDTPEQKRRLVLLLLKLSPFTFVLCYALAAAQGAKWQHSLLIAGIGALLCLGAAGLYHLRGSKAAGDAVWIAVLLRLLSR